MADPVHVAQLAVQGEHAGDPSALPVWNCALVQLATHVLVGRSKNGNPFVVWQLVQLVDVPKQVAQLVEQRAHTLALSALVT